MLGEYCVYADGHINAPHQSVKLKDLYADKSNHGKRCILLGDMYDISNTPKKELSKARADQAQLKHYFGKRYIEGNHECKKPDHGYYLVINGVLFCHGHTIFWSDKKVKKWEKKKGGRSAFAYFFYRFKHIIRKEGRVLNLSEKHKERCVDLMLEHDCHTIVFGHTHRSCDIKVYDKRIIGVPQGKTIIKI